MGTNCELPFAKNALEPIISQETIISLWQASSGLRHKSEQINCRNRV